MSYRAGLFGGGMRSADTGNGTGPAANWGGISQLFQKALGSLTGSGSAVEKMYDAGKRKTLSQIAMNMVNSGMANVLNVPAFNLAYEQDVRPGVDVSIAQALAQLYGQWAGVGANVYGTNQQTQLTKRGQDLDWASRTMDTGPSTPFENSFAGQMAALGSSAPSSMGGVMAKQVSPGNLEYLNMIV